MTRRGRRTERAVFGIAGHVEPPREASPVKAGDRVRLTVARHTIFSRNRVSRLVPRGVEGLVERNAGRVLRVVVTDAPDGRADTLIVSAGDVEVLP